MNRIIYQLVCIACFLPGVSQAQFSSNAERWKFYLSLSEKYSPEAEGILKGIDNWENYAQYADNAQNEEGLLDEYNTTVHETCHGFNHQIARENNTRNGYYVEPGLVIAVRDGKVYNSNEINSIVPDSLKEKIFRYEIYIGEPSMVSSQTNGIYGMLNEFSAYYHGTIASYRLRPYYEKKYGYAKAEPWVQGYLSDIGSTIYAFHEFRLFMAWYLKYALKKHRDVYDDLMNNHEFRRAFTLLYDRYEDLANLYSEVSRDVCRDLQEAGNDVRIDSGGWFMIHYGDNGGSWGISSYFSDIEFLKQLFTPELEELLNRLRVD